MVTRISLEKMREKILDTATELFFEKGIQAVGVDEIVAQAGIAKMTLYKYFFSKDQLILAVLQRKEEEWWQWFEKAMNRRGKLPIKRILAIFDLLAETSKQEKYQGEPLLNARIRVADKMYPIYLVTDSLRWRLREYILQLAREAELSSATAVTDQLMLLISGANILSLVEDPQHPERAARLAKKMATALINASQKLKSTDELSDD